jgi:hypothetical protein
MLTLPDQEVSALISFYMTVPVTPTGTPNGILRTFGLPSSPTNPTASQLFVIGGGGGGGTFIPYGSGYTISGSTITWVAATPPQTGDTIEIFYS